MCQNINLFETTEKILGGGICSKTKSKNQSHRLQFWTANFFFFHRWAEHLSKYTTPPSHCYEYYVESKGNILAASSIGVNDTEKKHNLLFWKTTTENYHFEKSKTPLTCCTFSFHYKLFCKVWKGEGLLSLPLTAGHNSSKATRGAVYHLWPVEWWQLQAKGAGHSPATSIKRPPRISSHFRGRAVQSGSWRWVGGGTSANAEVDWRRRGRERWRQELGGCRSNETTVLSCVSTARQQMLH